MAEQITFVFLHGAGTGAWVWDRVLGALQMPSAAFDVPGRKAGVTPDGGSFVPEALAQELITAAPAV